ncbi:hypothetical protein NDU88_008486 [Pleurodeles waltl]|uniref:Receptor ligand binding region domain-containing protein n=1 Tax=Pleurodeles waltl TaxID=8319 RepID=A0AAV7QSX5_PLEWA|nr:hypothetical protein NDU88_008486 [Pleurodeles waltl]
MAAMVGGMESEAKVREALALLRQAGRLDLLKEGALAPTRPARRASAGVAAMVAACSPPRVAARGKVRCASRGVVARGGPGAGPRRVYGRVRVGESSGVPQKPSRAERRQSGASVPKGRAGPRVEAGKQALEQGQIGALEASVTMKGKGKGKAAGARQQRLGVSQGKKVKPSAAGDAAASAARAIGYESTSVKLALKNFYPSFLRTIPSDDLQVSVLLHLLIQFNWTWIAVVASDNDYGRQGLQSLYGKALNIGICVAYQGVIPDNVNANGSAVQQMLTQINQSRVQVIVVYSTRRLARGFFKVAIGENITDKVWLATEDWSGSPLITDIPNIRSIGSVIGVSVKKSVDLALKEFEVTYVNSAKAQVPPLGEGCNQVCEKCHMFIPETMPIPSVFDLRAAFNVYSAVYAVAHGLHNLLNCSTGTCNKDTVYPWQLLKKIKKVSFTIHNQSISFDDKGDPLTGYDIVMWNWNEKNVSVCVIGSYSQHPSTLSINIDELKWHTKDNTVNSYCL